MPTEMRLWRIEEGQPKPISGGTLDLESRLENWLRDDIGLVNDELLVIGQQVRTAYGGIIDLLAIDSSGNLVILELKKDRTPRDIVAQALDYASWVQDMGHDAVVSCASDFFDRVGMNRTLAQAFRDKFNEDLPEVINESHRIYIVASSLDPATERIVEYLSETHSVDINAATFAYFKVGDDELIGGLMLLDEEVVQARAETGSALRRRRRYATEEELREVARENGVVELWDKAIRGFDSIFKGRPTFSQSTITWYARIAGFSAGAAIIGIAPGEPSSPENGLALRMIPERVAEHFSVSECEVGRICGSSLRDLPGFESERREGYCFDNERLDKLITLLSDHN